MPNKKTFDFQWSVDPVQVLKHGAQHFGGNISKYIAEALWNSFDYRRPGQKIVNVEITVHPTQIIIKDNGAGMSQETVQHRLFRMYGEVKRPAKSRNRFMTGIKMSARSVGKKLTVETVHARRHISLTARLDAAGGTATEVPTREGEGTTLILKELTVKPVSPEIVRQQLQNIFRSYLNKHHVTLNGQRLQYQEPEHRWIKEKTETKRGFGRAKLTLMYSPHPIPVSLRGVAIRNAEGIVHESNFKGPLDSCEFEPQVFGYLDWSTLEQPDSEHRESIRDDRDGLNNENVRVHAIKKWAIEHIKNYIAELRQRLNMQRAVEGDTARRLMERQLSHKVNNYLMGVFRKLNHSTDFDSDGDSVGGKKNKITEARRGQDLARFVRDDNGRFIAKLLAGNAGNGGDGEEREATERSTSTLKQPMGSLQHNGTRRGRLLSQHGGISVEIRRLGAGPRSKFVADESRIFINSDHPTIQKFPQDTPEYGQMILEGVVSEMAFLTLDAKIVTQHDPELMIDPKTPLGEAHKVYNEAYRREADQMMRTFIEV